MKVILFTVTFFGILGGHIVPPKSEMATQWLLKPVEFLPISEKTIEIDLEQLYCISEAIYYEARNQPLDGQFAVGLVIKNRVNFPTWPDTICQVVHEGHYWRGIPLQNQCQFSYWCDGLPEDEQEDEEAWVTAEAIGYIIMTTNLTIPGLERVTHFHHTSVKPDWTHKFHHCGTIGDHIFYCSPDNTQIKY